MVGGFARSMKRKSGGRQWGATEIAPTEAGETEESALADCCTCPFGGRDDTSCVWPGGCSYPSVPHARGGRGIQGLGRSWDLDTHGQMRDKALQGCVSPTTRTL